MIQRTSAKIVLNGKQGTKRFGALSTVCFLGSYGHTKRKKRAEAKSLIVKQNLFKLEVI